MMDELYIYIYIILVFIKFYDITTIYTVVPLQGNQSE